MYQRLPGADALWLSWKELFFATLLPVEWCFARMGLALFLASVVQGGSGGPGLPHKGHMFFIHRTAKASEETPEINQKLPFKQFQTLVLIAHHRNYGN